MDPYSTLTTCPARCQPSLEVVRARMALEQLLLEVLRLSSRIRTPNTSPRKKFIDKLTENTFRVKLHLFGGILFNPSLVGGRVLWQFPYILQIISLVPFHTGLRILLQVLPRPLQPPKEKARAV